MDQLGGQLLCEAVSDPLAVRIIVWVGLGFLSIAFGALMWAQRESSQTLSHAIALSIFAHLLLATFCYSTDVFSLPPGPGGEGSPFEVSLAGDLEDDPEIENAPTAEEPPSDEQPWDMPPAEPPVAPPLPPPEPAALEARELPPTKTPNPSALAAALPHAPLPAPEEPQPVESANPSPTPREELAGPTLPPPATETPESSSPMAAEAAPETPLPEQVAAQPGTSLPRAALASQRPPVSTQVPAQFASRTVPADALPAALRNRIAANRAEIVRRGGGDERTEAAVAAALQWLATHQSPDGRWDPDLLEGGRDDATDDQHRPGAGANADTGITGLALLAFQAGGHTHFDGPYRVHVQRGLEYLIRQQRRDGSLAGQASPYAAMYCHGMATIALAEACSLTGDARIKPALEQAVGYTLAAQHPSQGGWRYRPGDLGDMSQFGWQVMALKSAAEAGVLIPPRAHQRMLRFLAQSSLGPQGGLAAYRAGERPTPAMTAEALACRLFLGAGRDDAAVREAAEYLSDHVPRDGEKMNLYYWYYGTLALYQMQGPAWQKWNAVVRERLLASQESAGERAGSWDTSSQWGGYGGRAFTTSLAALCLQAYYRFSAIDDELQPEVNVAELPDGWMAR